MTEPEPRPDGLIIRANSLDIRHGVGIAFENVLEYLATTEEEEEEKGTPGSPEVEKIRTGVIHRLALLLDALRETEEATCAGCGQPIILRVHSKWVHTDDFESRKCASAAQYDDEAPAFTGTPSSTARPQRRHS